MKTTGALAGVAVVAIAALWLVPPFGFILCAAVLVVAPPWGRTLTERAIISVLIGLGIVAIVVPRASTVPITPMTAHAGLSLITMAVVAFRLIPRLRTAIPRPTVIDALTGLLAAVNAWWLMSAYRGQDAKSVLSGLFFTGWDNSGHFVPFSNTIESGQTLWPTVDGSLAWDQWYPSLHTTLYALAQLASQPTADIPGRPELLWPYVLWTSVAFALSIAALAWMASDLASRGAHMLRPDRRSLASRAPIVAFLAVAAFGVFGSPAWLFNYGFTNFIIAVAVLATSAYLAGRSLASARRLGWLLVPLAALAINGIWTPLILGLIPTGVVVWIALWRVRRWLAPVWFVASAALVGGTVLMQSRAITGTPVGESGSFLADLGQASVGMAPFNLGAAIAAAATAILVGVILLRARQLPLALSVGAPTLGILAFLAVAVYAAKLAHVGALQSYYVLKVLDALFIMNAPLLGALASLAFLEALHALKRVNSNGNPLVNRPNAVLAGVAGLLVGVSIFGLIAPRPATLEPNYTVAPGIEAGAVRASSTADNLVGEAILAAQDRARAYPDLTTFLWDEGGILPNIWLAALHGVMSVDQQGFYKRSPSFPYDEKTVEYVNLALRSNPHLNLAIMWFRKVSGEQVASLPQRNPGRVTLVQVPMRPSPLCEECSL